MEPTLHNNDVVISDHMIRKYRGVKYNDIVVAQSITDPKILVCKRVTALEGDLVLYCSKYIIVSIIPLFTPFKNTLFSNPFL